MLSPLFSFNTRPKSLETLSQTNWDVVVIGGGITGAAVARDAALRGLKVALVEANDFASGTSSGSSKLLHGGIRYLENFEFGLVQHSIKERELLHRLYSPLVQNIDFVFPTYSDSPPSRFMLNMGLLLYDSFSFFRQRHKNLNARETLNEYPYLEEKNLTGSCTYTDSFAEDYRLVIELIKAAQRNHASCVSRAKVTNLKAESDGVRLEVEDLISNRKLEVRGGSVFNCSGPFSDSIRKMLGLNEVLKLTQGVHFVVPKEKLPIDYAFVLSDTKLHRILFAIPWNKVTYLGTTDTPINKVEDARASSDDLEYVLKVVNDHLNSDISVSDVIQSWAAVRPLIKPKKNQAPSEISREHVIKENPKNIFHILGGKLTSHRLMAEEALDKIRKRYDFERTKTDSIPLQDKTEPLPSNRLTQTYGRYSKDIQELDQGSGKKLVEEMPHLVAEVLYAIHHEMALRPLDFLRRRSSLYYEFPYQSVGERTTEIFAKELNWNESQISDASREISESLHWDQDGYKKAQS